MHGVKSKVYVMLFAGETDIEHVVISSILSITNFGNAEGRNHDIFNPKSN